MAEKPKPVVEQLKPKGPAPLKRKRGVDPTEAEGTKDWPAGAIAFDVMRAYDAIKTKAVAKTLVYEPNGPKLALQAREAAVGDSYTPMVQLRKEGKEGAWDGYIEVGGTAADLIEKRTRSALLLRSNQHIIRFFNTNPHLNLVLPVEA